MSLALAGWLLASVTTLLALGTTRRRGLRQREIARACHEVRGPLTAARLGLEFAARQGGASPDRLRTVELEIGRAAIALDDLTELRHTRRPGEIAARYTASAEAVDLHGLAASSLQAWSPAAAAREVALRLDWRAGDAVVFGNRFRIAQALENLVANAIEHGGGAVEVRGRRTRETVRVEVLDEGPGLAAPVAQLARRGRRSRGRHGHGLAVAVAVATAHGGRVSAAPSQRGARIVLELPAARRSELIGEGG